MKILPPAAEWLPGMVRSRVGRVAIAAAGVTVVALALVLGRPDGRGGAPAAGTTDVACSALVLDRSRHTTRAERCPAEPLSAAAGGASERADMPPNANRLTDADRAIEPPEALRATVWDVEVARRPASGALSHDAGSLDAATARADVSAPRSRETAPPEPASGAGSPITGIAPAPPR